MHWESGKAAFAFEIEYRLASAAEFFVNA